MLTPEMIRSLMGDFDVSGADVREVARLMEAARAATGSYPAADMFSLADAVIYCLREAAAMAILAAESPFKLAAWNAMMTGAPRAIAA